MDRLQDFMTGRCGADHLFRFQAVAAVVLIIVGRWWWTPLWLAGIALLTWGLVRAFSRNLAARSRENAVYMEKRGQVLRWASLQKCRWRDRKTHVYCACPKCGKNLRLPKNQGRVVATCPCCGWQFERRT